MQPTSRQILLSALIFLVIVAIILHLNWIWQARTVSTDTYTGAVRSRFSIANKVLSFIKQPPKLKPTRLVLKQLDASGWSLDDYRDLFFEEIMNVHQKCSNLVRVGRQGDGGWDVCMEIGFTMSPGCLVYSFGVGNIWEFDEQMSDKYKCKVRAFDPTMGKPEHVHTPGEVYFYPLGIGGQANSTAPGFRTHNLQTFLKMFRDQDKTLDILKIDVEYSEWDALESIIKDGLLNRIKQVYLEYHTKEVIHKRSESADYKRYLTVMQNLEKAGFRKFRATRNHGAVGVFRKGLTSDERGQSKQQSRSCCYEVYYLNTAFKVSN